MNSALNFYQDNCFKKITFPKIPELLHTDKEITNWIFRQNVPYINIDLNFDLTKWQSESKFAENYYVVHRESQEHNGWKSCCIHGIDVDKTQEWHSYFEKEPEYNWTKLSEETNAIKQFVSELPFENLLRVRFMKLEPNGWIAPHNDSPKGLTDRVNLIDHILPMNIAITHPKECHMTLLDKGEVRWSEGNIKMVNITNYHSVINFSKEDRVHLIVHGKVGNRIDDFCKLIVRSYKKTIYEHS